MKDKKAFINDQCINCGMCFDICPYSAICEAGDVSDVKTNDEKYISDEHFFVNREKCVGCGRCVNTCPVKNITLE